LTNIFSIIWLEFLCQLARSPAISSACVMQTVGRIHSLFRRSQEWDAIMGA